jgi:hypothetical protein
MSQRCPLLGPFRSHFTICLFPWAPMETWICWHLMKISESIDAHRREKNMQKRTWRKNDTEGSHSFPHSTPPICEVWHIIAERVGNECLCHSSFYESEALTHTQRFLLLLLGYSAYKSYRSSILRNQALLRHGVGIMTTLRAGRSVARIPTADMNFSLFPKVPTVSRAFRDFAMTASSLL